jgi:NodT family efflux transporter outer membrane factor (OMF) lipoprotein
MSPLFNRHLPAACCALALAGCNLAPTYQRPSLDTSAPFKEAVPDSSVSVQGWKLAEPNDQALGGSWWEQYHDGELSALEEKVAISNQTVAAAEANYRVARALLSGAQSAYYPSVTLDPSVIRSRSSASIAAGGGSSGGSSTSSSSGSGGGGGVGPRTDYTLPFEASYEVDLWGSVRNTVAQSSFGAQASAAAVETALLSSQSALAQAYFALRASDEQRRILDTTLADYEASLHLVRTLYNNGLASEEDLALADTQLDGAEAQATDLGIARAQYEHAIAVLIGVSPERFSISVSPFRPELPEIPVSLPSALLERRPDIAAAERQVEAANAGIGVARAAYFPNITVGATAGYAATSLSKLLDWPDRIWSVGPTLVMPIFEGGLRRAENAQARAAYDAEVASYRQTALAAFQSVEDNIAGLRILSKEVVQQHRAAAAAQRLVQLSITRYQDGLDSYVNVITAQNTFLTNRLAELQVQLRQVTASIALVNNLGGGWDASQLGQTEKAALHPAGAGAAAEAPAANAGPGVPNPPPLPQSVKRPEDILGQNAGDMAPEPRP